MKKKIIFRIFISILIFSIFPYSKVVSKDIPPNSIIPTPQPVIRNIETAIRQAINTTDDVLGYLLFNVQISHIKLSTDQKQATAWLTFVTDNPNIPSNSEPGLAIIFWENDHWETILPSSDKWLSALNKLPSDLMPPTQKQAWLKMYNENTQIQNVGPFGGYLLPWEGGKSLYLTRSITHYNPPNPNGSMHYAFDFAAPHDSSGKSPMFEIYASKSGTVKYARWWQPNGSESSPGNYIVLEDTTTTPTTYQLYLHLAQDSIPEELRALGTPVKQGEFIGLADDTGYSTGNHLHFQVHTNPYSYWGDSVDITFDDVSINGGRPRTPYEADHYPEYGNEGQWTYTSGNYISNDSTPPTGDILTPEIGATIYGSVWHLEGWATDDDSGLASAQFIARYNGTWHTISQEFQSSLFSYDWDVCTENVPNGPVTLALFLKDKRGNITPNYPGLRHITKHFSCTPDVTPPPCQPSAQQVALFSQMNYQGECTLLSVGNYPDNEDINLTPLEGIASLLLGDDVHATLFTEFNYEGRSESFEGSDANLDDNLIGAHATKSLIIKNNNDAISPPLPTYPANNETFANTQSLILAWKDVVGSMSYRVNFTSDTGTTITQWGDKTTLSLGTLPTGTYTWTVQGSNQHVHSDWSSPRVINIIHENGSNVPVVSAPFTDTFESSIAEWTSTGLWHLENNEAAAHSGTKSWQYNETSTASYDTHSINFGTLTSPPITLPVSSSPYFIQFWSWFNTESDLKHWDQRYLQISIDNEPFTNVIQLSHEPMSDWFQYTINLNNIITDTTNSEHTISVRFFFHTIDTRNNNHEGWRIDDFSVFSAPLSPCVNDSYEPNDIAEKATPISFGDSLTAEICPNRDIDFYKFTGNQGERIVIDVDAKSRGSNLDSILYLLDCDGKSVLAQNDDEVLGIKQDPHLSYILPRNGTYYIQVNAWDFPEGKGEYLIKLIQDESNPSINITTPTTNSFLKDGLNTIHVNATDSESGIKNVDFFWHSNNWDNNDWENIGSDTDPDDGWYIDFDTSPVQEGKEIIFYVFAYDWAGNWNANSAWNLVVDKSPPNTNAQANPNPPDSTAIHLSWNSEDNLSGISHFDIRYKLNNGEWKPLAENVPAAQNSLWFVGEPSNNYNFQIRAIDNAGNSEQYSTGGNALASIPSPEVLCQNFDQWDIDDTHNDNDIASATEVSIESDFQIHSFCNPAHSDYLYDEDWIKFTIEANQDFYITAKPSNQNTAVNIHLFDNLGTLIKSSTQNNWGNATTLSFHPSQAGTYYVKLTHNDGRVIGDSVKYTLYIGKTFVFLPIINK